MCGRFARFSDREKVIQALEACSGGDRDVTEPAAASYNIHPGQKVLTAVLRDGSCRLQSVSWGLLPFWSKRPRAGSQLINARVETLVAKPAFRPLINRRRCLIPADGFYEWRLDREQGRKVPYYFWRKDGRLIFFAGLWDNWIDSRTDALLSSCTIITTAANQMVRPVHDRMPAMLEAETLGAWLDVATVKYEKLAGQLRPCRNELLECREVTDAVSQGIDSPECVKACQDRPLQGVLF